MSVTIICGSAGQVKETGHRADFRVGELDLTIALKGQRVWWSRAGLCPCRNNALTGQPDPACSLCKGLGLFFFLPEQELETETVDAWNNPIVLSQDRTGVMINGILMAATRDPQIYEKLGDWVFGTARFTAQAPNKLGWGDRLTLVDSRMAWTQLITADGTDKVAVIGRHSDISLRYPLLSISYMRSLTHVYRLGEDYRIQDDGSILWHGTPPAKNTIITIHGMVHPVYRVMDHFYAFRDTYIKRKKPLRDKTAQFTELPSQCLIKLDFLLDGTA